MFIIFRATNVPAFRSSNRINVTHTAKMQADVCVVSMLSRLHKHKVCLGVWHMKNKAAVRIRGAHTSLFRSFCVIFSVTLLPLVLFPFFFLYFSYPSGVPLSIVSDLSSSCLSFLLFLSVLIFISLFPVNI